MPDIQEILSGLKSKDKRSLARALTLVENNLPGAEELLCSLKPNLETPVIGVTGPPGAGKSTLVNSLITTLLKQGKTIGVLAVDPTSPFNFGSLLGDRVRMSDHFLNENVFIRSLATRGSLGGLSARTIEMADVMRSAGFDYIFIETVGVGQSEIEIAGLADTTILVLVPEAGDEVQAIKSGIMEIADIFVINKSDRPGADLFSKNLLDAVQHRGKTWIPPIVKCVATKNQGADELIQKAAEHFNQIERNLKFKASLFARKAFKIIQERRMRDIDPEKLEQKIEIELKKEDFNLYQFALNIQQNIL